MNEIKRYLDFPLIAFTVAMIAAASITSHGTYRFYSYFLEWYLAASATIVITGGIPLLEFAAVLEPAKRRFYIAGMCWLLLMEGLAQYWDGQAVFVKRVMLSFPDATGVDLATWAQHWTGRALPILYLVTLSGIVVYFGYAASVRIQELRGVVSHSKTPTVAAQEGASATKANTVPVDTADTDSPATTPVKRTRKPDKTSAVDTVDISTDTPDILRLRESGLSFEAIGKMLGVSRQSAYQKYVKLTRETA